MKSHRMAVLGLAGIVVLTGCATVKPSATSAKGSRGQLQEGSATDQAEGSDSLPVVRGSQGEITIRGVKLENTNFDYPITINSKVEQWVGYFLGRGRPHFARYLERSEHFIPFIIPILKQNNMPEDLVYLAMIESGFNNHARSHAKAVGPWQFISATGKRYGLMVNWWVDERRDTRKSTLAAVEYLKDLHGMFNSWELAAAAYNAGENKIARAIQRYGTKDFWALTRHRYLRVETRDYVPKIIAAALIAKNRTQFGFPASTLHPSSGEMLAPDGELVKVDKDTSGNQALANAETDETLASILSEEAPEDEIEDGEGTPAPRTTPAGAQRESGAPLARAVPTPFVSKTGEVSGEATAEIEVQSPADLLHVANAAGLSYATVKALNPDVLRWCTPPTVATYRLKLPASVKDKFLEAYNHGDYPKKVQFLTYKVRRNESLIRIASHFGIKSDPMGDLNGISVKRSLSKGTKVLLPIPNDPSRSLASLEVRDPPEKRKSRKVRKGVRKSAKSKVTFKRRQAARARNLDRDT